MRVLIVCEDHTHDQYIVKPIAQRLFDELGKRIRLDVLNDPHLRGFDDLLSQIDEIVADNPMEDLFLVIVDRDCDRMGNSTRITTAIARHRKAVACLAIEEVESWMLCVHRASLPVSWSQVRADCDVKEHFALPFLERLGAAGPGQGRKTAMRNLGQEWRALLQLCPELQELAARLQALT